METRPPGTAGMTLEEARRVVLAEVNRLEPRPMDADHAAVPADPAIVERVPAWVRRHLLVECRGELWVRLEPRRGGSTGGQLTFRLPPGRYLADTFDEAAGDWVARESAAGAPLVIGVPAAVGAVWLRIRRVAEPPDS